VELAPDAGDDSLSTEAVIGYVKGKLASYKAPRQVRFVETIGRSPSGKVDYARHRAESAEWLGVSLHP
jgi:acyl-CoA synthetase (AMP-forming)/AMP-acid ligase II